MDDNLSPKRLGDMGCSKALGPLLGSGIAGRGYVGLAGDDEQSSCRTILRETILGIPRPA